MPSRHQHLAQARRNREFSESLDRTRYPESVMVAWFYSALHLVDAFLDAALPDSEAPTPASGARRRAHARPPLPRREGGRRGIPT